MPAVFNANEILEIAKQIEKNGAAFYRKAASQKPDAQAVLLSLATQEDEHFAAFQKMQKDLPDAQKESTAFDPDNESAMYLKTMAGGYIFDVKKNPSDMLKGNETLQQVLQLAIGLEKDSVVFYLGIKEMVPRKLGADTVDLIIKEEMRHIRVLGETLAKA